MKLLAGKAGLLAAAILATLVSGGSYANAGEDQVAMCYVSEGNPEQESDVRVDSDAVEEMLTASMSYPGVCASYGESARLGDGLLRAYSQFQNGAPHAIGVSFTRDTLSNLPHDPPTEGEWCYDVNQDGTIDQHTECVGGYERVLHFSDEFRSQVDSEFRYIGTNWNPHGHPPPHTYDAPHFDVHFYTMPNQERLAIRPGPCPVLVNCDDFQKATKPLEPKYVPRDYTYTTFVEPGMGNHMMDLTSDEYHGEPFDHTFIYGHYDAKMTFYEPMVTLATYQDLVAGKLAGLCVDMKLPQAWQTSGWYPTQYCLRYRENREELITTLEEFVYREAS